MSKPSRRETSWFDRAIADATVFVFIRCGGSGGRCNVIYGAVVDDGPGDPATIIRSGHACRHNVNPWIFDLVKLDALTAKARARRGRQRPLTYHLPVLDGPQPTPREQMQALAAAGRIDLHEAPLPGAPSSVASRQQDTEAAAGTGPKDRI